MKDHFEHLILLGRPASGKSEIIDYLKNLSAAERLEKFHIASFEEIDDFPWLWEKFEEDDLWKKAGYPRKYSKEYEPGNLGLTPEGAPLIDFCMEKFNEEIAKKYLSNPGFYNDNTLFIEFARGGAKDYKDSLARLSPEIFDKAAILFIDVTKDESWRRNVARYEEKKRHSILAHRVPEKTYDYYYGAHDWPELTGGKAAGHLDLKGVKVPFVTMNNEPELPPGPEIAERYKKALDKLYELTCRHSE